MLGVALAGIVMGWPLNAFVLGSPFLLQWTMLQLAAVLALVLLPAVKNAPSPLPLAGVIFCGVIATFSSANGMLLWPVLIVAGLLLQISLSRVAWLAGAAVGSIGVFFIGYDSQGLGVLTLIEHPIRCAGFVISYVSMPFGVIRNPSFGFVFGSISVVSWIALAILTIRSSALSPTARSVFFGYYAFVVFTALLTAAGRIDLQDTGFGAAKAGRYLTVPLAAWGALLEAAILACATNGKIVSQRAITATAVVVMLFMQVRLARWLRSEDRVVVSSQLATLSIRNGILDDSLLRAIFPHPNFVRRYLPELKDSRLSIYSEQVTEQRGRSVRKLFPAATGGASEGKVLRIAPLDGGVEVVASIRGKEEGRRGNVLLFVDEHGKIVGFGQRLTKALSALLAARVTQGTTGWVGFIPDQDGESRFSMFLADTRSSRSRAVIGTVAICRH